MPDSASLALSWKSWVAPTSSCAGGMVAVSSGRVMSIRIGVVGVVAMLPARSRMVWLGNGRTPSPDRWVDCGQRPTSPEVASEQR